MSSATSGSLKLQRIAIRNCHLFRQPDVSREGLKFYQRTVFFFFFYQSTVLSMQPRSRWPSNVFHAVTLTVDPLTSRYIKRHVITVRTKFERNRAIPG